MRRDFYGQPLEIPEMTHPLGKHWDAPNRSEVQLFSNQAMMSRKAFNKLHTYNTSNPSGVYEGKMWKSRMVPYRLGRYMLCWWETSAANPDMCVVRTRKIVLTD